MGVEMKLSLTADDTASPVIDKVSVKVDNLGAGGPGKIEQLTAALNTLGLKSDDAFDRMVKDATGAFDQIKNSGVASTEEIVRAERALAQKLEQVFKESAGAFGAAMEPAAVKTVGIFENMGTKIKGVFSAIKTAWLEIAAVIAALTAAWTLAKEAAGFAEQRDSLNALAAQYGTTADAMVARIKEVTGNLVGMAVAVDTSATALKNGMNPDQVYAMATAAEKLSNITGADVPESFAKMTEAIALGRERALEAELGAISLEERFGKVVTTWTDAEKVAGRLQIVMERVAEASELLGEGVQSADDKFAAFAVEWADFKIGVGDVAVRLFMALDAAVRLVAVALDAVAISFTDAARAALYLVPGMAEAKASLASFRAELQERLTTSADKAVQSLKIVASGMGQVEGKANAAATAAKALAAAQVANTARLTQGIKELEGVVDTWRGYYAKVSAEHARVVNEIETRQKAHVTAMKAIDEALEAGAGALRSLAPEQREGEAWLNEKARLQELYNQALAKEGSERVAALKDYIEQRAQFRSAISDEALGIEQQIGSITAYSQVAVTAEDAIANAQNDVKQAMAELAAEADRLKVKNDQLAVSQQAQADSLKTAMDSALLNLKNYQAELNFLEESLAKNRILSIDTADALAGAKDVKAAIDAIPDVSYKTVVMEFKTKASPVRPFGEGMDEIYDRLAKLPNEAALTIKMGESVTDLERDLRAQLKESGTYRNSVGINWGGTLTSQEQLLAQRNQYGDAKGGSGTGAASSNSTTNATFNVTATSQSAKDLDAELASLWNSKRSKLRQAMEAA